MTEPILMPKFGMTMSEGTIVEWEKGPGDHVEKGEVLLKIESDKAEMDVEAQRSGYIVSIDAEPDEVVQCGEVIGMIGDSPDG